MVRIHALVAALAIAPFAVGCGQKGPLVLPDAQRPHKKVVVPHGNPGSAPATAAPPASTPADATPATASPNGSPSPGASTPTSPNSPHP